MNWITIKDVHINLDNIISFNWQNNSLYLLDGTNDPYEFKDDDRLWYRKLCNRCCMNMAEVEAKLNETNN